MCLWLFSWAVIYVHVTELPVKRLCVFVMLALMLSALIPHIIPQYSIAITLHRRNHNTQHKKNVLPVYCFTRNSMASFVTSWLPFSTFAFGSIYNDLFSVCKCNCMKIANKSKLHAALLDNICTSILIIHFRIQLIIFKILMLNIG